MVIGGGPISSELFFTLSIVPMGTLIWLKERWLLPTAQRVHVDRQSLAGEPVDPGGHHAGAGIGDDVGDRRVVGAVEPDRIGEVRRAELLVALAGIAMTDGAIVGVELLACGGIEALRGRQARKGPHGVGER